MKKIVIVRKEKDILSIKNLIEPDIQEEISSNLLGLSNLYKQFAYDFATGDVLFAIYEDSLHISLEAANKFFEIKQFYYVDYVNDKEPPSSNPNNYKCYFYDSEKKDIVCAIDENNNLQIIGDVIYDSLEDHTS